MTDKELKQILDDHAKWLSGEDGQRADLRWADLRQADLRGVNLSWASLSGANLSGASLSGVNLSWANLSGANLSEANLSGANLRGVNLSGANLQNVTTIKRVEVSWTDHGECGRKLLAVQVGDEVRYFCGCFSGSIDDLRKYIADGDDKYKPSRTIAADFCEARMQEMLEANNDR